MNKDIILELSVNLLSSSIAKNDYKTTIFSKEKREHFDLVVVDDFWIQILILILI